jgi:hypothetical protein
VILHFLFVVVLNRFLSIPRFIQSIMIRLPDAAATVFAAAGDDDPSAAFDCFDFWGCPAMVHVFNAINI